ncbi:MAG TPA: DUF4190 domain-containing protein [Terriglobia bacterium]|nr:DUF4190 domain-containing protein [Terriglobia bacterium]
MPRNSGKAIASLVLGIFPVVPLVGTILAIVFGHMARAEIRRSGGRLKGDGMALAGLILGYGVPVMILIIAAIAIPNLLKSKMAANQASAVASLRTLNTSEITYASTFNVGYSSSLAQLGPPASGDASSTAAGLIDSVLATGDKSGYSFIYTADLAGSSGRTNSYTIIAVPVSPGQTGQNYYFTDETNVIRQNTQSTASASDSPIGR